MGRYPSLPEPLVDAGRQLLHHFVQFLVALDLGAARRGQLSETESAAEFRVPLEQQLNRQQAFLDALGVVQPVDADAEQRVRLQSQIAPHLGAAFLGTRRRLDPADGPFERDGIRTDQRAVPLHHHRVMLAVDARFQIAVHRIQEIVAVELRVEAENAAAQQALPAVRCARGRFPCCSAFGQGMCQNTMTVAAGRRLRIIAGASAK